MHKPGRKFQEPFKQHPFARKPACAWAKRSLAQAPWGEKMFKHGQRIIISLLLVSLIHGCVDTSSRRSDPASRSAPSAGPGASQGNTDQTQILQAQSQRAEKVEVFFSARVRKLLPDDTKGLPHQRFLLLLENGSTVLVAHDIKYAPKVPIQEGDVVTIKGEYIWNARGGVVHWTHHSDTPRHEGGFIDFGGSRYE